MQHTYFLILSRLFQALDFEQSLETLTHEPLEVVMESISFLAVLLMVLHPSFKHDREEPHVKKSNNFTSVQVFSLERLVDLGAIEQIS